MSSQRDIQIILPRKGLSAPRKKPAGISRENYRLVRIAAALHIRTPCAWKASFPIFGRRMRTGLPALRARSPGDSSIPPPKKDTPDGVSFFGGATRNRTGESRICSPLPYRLAMAPYTMRFAPIGANRICMERPTRLELATSTLARWRSTR